MLVGQQVLAEGYNSNLEEGPGQILGVLLVEVAQKTVDQQELDLIEPQFGILVQEGLDQHHQHQQKLTQTLN